MTQKELREELEKLTAEKVEITKRSERTHNGELTRLTDLSHNLASVKSVKVPPAFRKEVEKARKKASMEASKINEKYLHDRARQYQIGEAITIIQKALYKVTPS